MTGAQDEVGDLAIKPKAENQVGDLVKAYYVNQDKWYNAVIAEVIPPTSDYKFTKYMVNWDDGDPSDRGPKRQAEIKERSPWNIKKGLYFFAAGDDANIRWSRCTQLVQTDMMWPRGSEEYAAHRSERGLPADFSQVESLSDEGICDTERDVDKPQNEATSH